MRVVVIFLQFSSQSRGSSRFLSVSQMVIQEQVLAAPKINVQRFVEIIISPIFPEQESKEWVLQHQNFAIQVILSFSPSEEHF